MQNLKSIVFTFIIIVVSIHISACKKKCDIDSNFKNGNCNDTIILGDSIINVYFSYDTLVYSDTINAASYGNEIKINIDTADANPEFIIRCNGANSPSDKVKFVKLDGNGKSESCFIDCAIGQFGDPLLCPLSLSDTIFNFSNLNYTGGWWCAYGSNNSSGWILYRPPGYPTNYFSLQEGIIYLGFRFSKEDGNRVGWIKIYFTHQWLYLLEAHYNKNINSKIVVGQTE